MNHPQKPLPLELRSKYSFDTYYDFYNAESVGLLKGLAKGNADYAIWYCWGAASSGKSHLIKAMCEQANVNNNSCYYLDLSKKNLVPEILEGLDVFDIVCLDAIDSIISADNWQLALFNFINQMMTNNKIVLLVSQKNVKEHRLKLKDLTSRMAWGINIKINAPKKQHINPLFCFKAAQMGLEMGTDVARYLENYVSADIKKIVAVLTQINEQALSQKKKNITVSFVKKLLVAGVD